MIFLLLIIVSIAFYFIVYTIYAFIAGGKKGVRELVLISQDTTRYGRDINNDKSLLPNLLEDLAMSEKFDFIRFLYLYPDEIQDELLDVVAKYDCITPYFDVPIQHASTKVLTRMNRRGNKEFLQSLVCLFVNGIGDKGNV